MQRKLLGVDHPDVALALNNLAFLAHDKGDLNTAAEMSRDSLEMYRRTVGKEHPSVAQGMNNLAMWLIEDGDLKSAEPLVRESLEMRRKLLGPDHADVAGSMTLLAVCLIETGRYEEALDARHRTPRPSCSRRWPLITGERPAPTAAEGASARRAASSSTKAEKLLLASYTVLHNDKGAVHIYVTNSSRWLAKLYQAMGQPDKADRYRVGRHG